MRITWDELKGEFQSDYGGKVQLKGKGCEVIRVPPGEYHILYKEIFLRIKKDDLQAFINYLKKKKNSRCMNELIIVLIGSK